MIILNDDDISIGVCNGNIHQCYYVQSLVNKLKNYKFFQDESKDDDKIDDAYMVDALNSFQHIKNVHGLFDSIKKNEKAVNYFCKQLGECNTNCILAKIRSRKIDITNKKFKNWNICDDLMAGYHSALVHTIGFMNRFGENNRFGVQLILQTNEDEDEDVKEAKEEKTEEIKTDEIKKTIVKKKPKKKRKRIP